MKYPALGKITPLDVHDEFTLLKGQYRGPKAK
jgi:hypothetical protein